jgi:TonB family protein
MERLFLECSIRAALLVAGAALVLQIFRVRNAAARHSVWTGVVVIMLFLPAWMEWGFKVPLRILPPVAQAPASDAAIDIAVLPTTLGHEPMPTWQLILVSVYLLGLVLLIFRLVTGAVRARRLLRSAVLQEGVRTSHLCFSPVTVGLFRPAVILPEGWQRWPQAQIAAVLTHEKEHARRRDSLVQCLALLNRALFWFHPVSWWLERNLAALAEEVSDSVVLANGHRPRDYAQYLLNISRSLAHSGRRLNIAGMTMPGSFVPRRIRQIMEGSPVPQVSRSRMALVFSMFVITSTLFATGALDRRNQNLYAQSRRGASGSNPAKTVFVLSDLKIDGEVHDRDGVRKRVLSLFKGREYGDAKQLADQVMEIGVRADFQQRGYFRVFVHDPAWQSLGATGGKERTLVVAPVTEGDQFRLGTLNIAGAAPDRPLTISAEKLRGQFRINSGDLFNVTELRAGIQRVEQMYRTAGYPDANVEPDAEVDDASRRVNFTLRITEKTSQQASAAAPAESSQFQVLTPHEGVDLTDFSKDMVQTIKRNWYAQMPRDARAGQSGQVVVRFSVQKNGKLGNPAPKIEVSSGQRALDQAAVAAIRASTPFDQLPDTFKGKDIELRLTFRYNVPTV